MNKLFYCFIFIIIVIQTLANNTIDHDYWARLLQGNYFWNTGSVLKHDIFSYTQTHLWIDHEWGSSAVFSFIQNNFGFTGILLFKILLVSLIFILIFKTIKLQTDKNSNVFNIILFFVSVYALPTLTQSGLRCHFFTFFFFTLFIYLLELVRKTNNQKIQVFLPLIFLIWCNMHGGCVSGLGVIAIYAIGEALNKKSYKNYIYTLLFSFALMFINPYGTDFVKFIFTASTMPRPYITEWISPFLHPVWNFMIWFKLLILFYAGVIIKNFKSVKCDYTKFILLFVCLIISCRNVKSTPFFIITAGIFLYEYIVMIFPKNINKLFEILLIIVCIVISAFSLDFQFFLREQPYKTVEFLKVNKLQGKILAPMEMGSYIAYKLYPDNLIYMDGRYEEVYYEETKNLADDFYNVKENWQEILKTQPDYIIIPYDALINDFMEKNKNYTVIWTDKDNILYCLKEKLKPVYKMPVNNEEYYIKTAFEKSTAENIPINKNL